jgi:hypothetical protein
VDANFFEFWGNLVIGIARVQKQLDDMMRSVHQGFPGADDLTDLFKKTYGLHQFPQAPAGGLNPHCIPAAQRNPVGGCPPA